MSKNNTLVLYCVSSVCHSLFNIYIYIYVNQWKTTTNTSFINGRSFISLQDNYQLKIVTKLKMTIYQMVSN